MLKLVVIAAVLTSQASAYKWQSVTSSSRYPPRDNMMFFNPQNFPEGSVCRWKPSSANYALSGRNNDNTCYVSANNDLSRALPFEVLAYDNRADNLVWETNPSLSTYTSRGILASVGAPSNQREYVCGDSRYGIGSLWTSDSRCYVHSAGAGIAVGSSQALTTAKATLYEMYDMNYNLNEVSASNRDPIFGNVDRNSNDSPNSIFVELFSRVEYKESYEWELSEYFEVKTKVKVKAGVPVYFQLRWTISGEYSFEYDYAESCESEFEFSKRSTYEIPAYNRCELYAYLGQADMNVPYTGQLRSTYPNGSQTNGPIAGIYTGLPVVESESVFSCAPLRTDGSVIEDAPATTHLANVISEQETFTVKAGCRL